MNNYTEILDWDTHFFAKKIAKIVITAPNERYIEDKLLEYRALDFDLVYIFTPGDMLLSLQLCSSYNCKLVDCKVVYNHYIQEEYQDSSSAIEFQGEAPQLYDLAIQSGEFSRYRIDTNFGEGDFLRLYRAWIDNSVRHLIADNIFVFSDGQNMDGFVTVKIHKDGNASIGLIATDLKKRGKGLGSSLLLAAKKYAKDKKALNLNVATQRENTIACSFYEKNGFSLQSVTNIYHAWLKK